MRREKRVELIQHNARRDANGPFVGVEIADLPIVSCEVNDKPVTNRPTGQARTRTTRNNGNTGIGRVPNHAGRLG